MDRCAMAYQYRKEGYNCAQAVAASFADLTGLTPEAMMAAAKGFGGGVGGSFQELCGAVSGGVLVLGMLDPDVTETDRAGRKRVYPKAKALRDRFEETFGHIHCEPPAPVPQRKRLLRRCGWGSRPTATSWW